MRIVVRAPNWLGDAVMALPALHAIQRHFSGATVAVAAPAGLAPLFESMEGVAGVVPLPGGRRDAAALAAGLYDVGVLFPNSFSSALAMKRAGVPERWGYRSDLRGRLLTRAVKRPRRRPDALRHDAHQYQELVRGLGIEPSPLESRIQASPELRTRARALLDQHGDQPFPARLVGLAPGAAYGQAKRWPPDRFAELIVGAWRELNAACVMVGSTGDLSTGRAIESSFTRRVSGTGRAGAGMPPPVNLIGKTDLPLLTGVIAHCAAFISNDSGAMHLAAAIGVPVVAIFGPTNEHATRPLGNHELVLHPVWCRPCMLRACPIDHRCMTRIGAPDVLHAVTRQLVPYADRDRVTRE